MQLEGTENRITVARNRYIKAVADYNVLARSFPTNLTAMMFSYAVKPSFTVQNEAQISAPPTVSFDKPAVRSEPRSARLRRMRRLGCACCCALLLAAAGAWPRAAQDVLPVPPLAGRVIDQTGTLQRRAGAGARAHKLAAHRARARLADRGADGADARSPRTSPPTRSAWPTAGRSAAARSATAC